MKWKQVYEPGLKENYIEIHYSKMDRETSEIMELVNPQKELAGKNGTEIRLIKPMELYYCEIVDRKCFAYLENEVFELEVGLQELCDAFWKQGLVRISKSMLVNMYKIKSLSANLNMKAKITLKNDEIVMLNRGYRSEFFHALENLRLEKKNENNQ